MCGTDKAWEPCKRNAETTTTTESEAGFLVREGRTRTSQGEDSDESRDHLSWSSGTSWWKVE